VFALVTYLLVHLYLAHDEPFWIEDGFNLRRSPFEVVVIWLGLSVVVLVSYDAWLAVLNGGKGEMGDTWVVS
jgi:hypothetical protein